MQRLTLSVLSFLAQDYCASKFGVVGFHESLSHELKAAEKDGIKTTLVCPYLVDTGMFRGCRIRSVGTRLLTDRTVTSGRCVEVIFSQPALYLNC